MKNTDEALNHMSKIMTFNTNTTSLLGARAMVLSKFFDAALPQLTALQRSEVTRSFRNGITDAMSLMDDLELPDEYYSAMFQVTNTILNKLGEEAVACS